MHACVCRNVCHTERRAKRIVNALDSTAHPVWTIDAPEVRRPGTRRKQLEEQAFDRQRAGGVWRARFVTEAAAKGGGSGRRQKPDPAHDVARRIHPPHPGMAISMNRQRAPTAP
jgi:hypothetical protein